MENFALFLLTKSNSSVPLIGPLFDLIKDFLGAVMNWIYVFLENIGIPNIGIAIILFTLITRIILFPTTLRQQKSSRLMKVMQPELKAIQDKYKNKKDNISAMQMQEEMKAVYEKYGTSMTSGCLPLLVQLPIILALYRIIMNIPGYVPSVKAIYEPVVKGIGGAGTAERVLEFINNNGWSSLITGLNNLGVGDASILAEDVENYMIDVFYKFNPTQWSAFSEVFSEASSVIQAAALKSQEINSFLGLNLSTSPSSLGFTPNVYWLIPILAGLSQWLSARIMQKSSPTPQDDNDQSANMMKSMNIMMPLFSVWICFSLAAGVGLYWIASSLIMLLQQLGMNWYFGRKSTEELIQETIAKTNLKREKKGLPPINEKTVEERINNLQDKINKSEQRRMELIAKQSVKTKESTEYYNRNAKPGSLASKADMVRLYNEKNEKK